MITLADVLDDARRLEVGGTPSVKWALWMGLLTAHAGIAETCEQARRLAKYKRRRLQVERDSDIVGYLSSPATLVQE